MSFFQIASSVGIAGAVVVCILHYLAVGRKAAHPGLGERAVRRYNLWERLIHAVLLLSFLVLAVTGFWASIGWGGPMEGYVLMLHTTCGATFAVTLMVGMLTWAKDHAFSAADGRWLRKGGCLEEVKDLPAGRFNAADKIFFWLAGLGTLVALLSMLLSMMPLLGQAGQHLMYDVHRWSTLALVVLVIWHAYMTTLAKPGGLGAILFGYVSAAWAKRFHPLWGKSA
jgi:formate dehydrogenase subunit gamma